MKKLLYKLGLGTIPLASILGVVSCNTTPSVDKKIAAPNSLLFRKAQNDLSLISSKLTTKILKMQLNKHLEQERALVTRLNKDSKYLIKIDSAELSDVKYDNGKVSYKITFKTTKQNVKYTRIEEAKNAEILYQNTQGTKQLGIKVTTKSINNRIADLAGRSVEDVIPIRRLLGKWDNTLRGISNLKESSIVKNIKLFHTNDSHGRMDTDFGKYNKYIGMNRVGGYVNNTKHDLFLSGGDFMQGTGVSNYDKGIRAMKIASLMGYDAMAAGNHEFDFGYKALLERAKTAPIYSTNTLYNGKNGTTDGNEVLPGVRTKIIKGDLPVGIITLTTPDVKTKVNPANIVDIKMESMYAAAKKEVKRLEDAGVKLIIAVGHMGNEAASSETSEELAKRVKGIDLIIDGHSHKLYKPGRKVIRADGEITYLAQTGSYTRNLGEINFDFDRKTGKITRFSNKYLGFNQIVTKIKPIEKLVKESKDAYKEYGGKAAFDSKIDLGDSLILAKNTDGTDNIEKAATRSVRTFEASVGDFFADALRWIGKTKAGDHGSMPIIGVTNSGGVRTSIAKGQRNVGDIVSLSPFNNTAEGVEVTGKQLWAIFNHSAKEWQDGGFAQVSKNVEVVYKVFKDFKKDDKESTDNNIVESIKINGVVVKKDNTQKYFMMTNDFMLGGGDGYKETMTTLKKAYSGGTLSDELIAFGKFLQTGNNDFKWDDYSVSDITPNKAGRIKVNGGDEKAKTFINNWNNLF